jgi:hypothetical protein
VARDVRLTSRQKALLYALIDRLDGRLVTRVSHAALAQDIGCSVDTIERAQRELVGKQMVAVTHRRKNGHQGPSEYRLPLRFMDLGAHRLPIVSWETDKLASLPEPPAAGVVEQGTVPDPQVAALQSRNLRDDRGSFDRDLEIPDPSIPIADNGCPGVGGGDGSQDSTGPLASSSAAQRVSGSHGPKPAQAVPSIVAGEARRLAPLAAKRFASAEAPFIDERAAEKELVRVVLEGGVPIHGLERWIALASRATGHYAGIYHHRPGSTALAVARHRAIALTRRTTNLGDRSAKSHAAGQLDGQATRLKAGPNVVGVRAPPPPRDLLARLDATLREGATARKH